MSASLEREKATACAIALELVTATHLARLSEAALASAQKLAREQGATPAEVQAAADRARPAAVSAP